MTINESYYKNNKPSKLQDWDEIPKAPWKNLPTNTKVDNLLLKVKQQTNLKKSKSLTILENINKRIINSINNNKKPEPVDDLISILANIDVLRTAYAQIYKNKGALTPGTADSTADNFDLTKLSKLSEKIKNESFKWTPTKRVFIPKPGKKEKRPLGLPNFTDKVVQSAIRLILQSIIEPHFEQFNSNYGFRPNKDTIQAIRNIEIKAQGTNYAIEGDIKGAYDNVNHGILMQILNKYIKCKKFLRIIHDGLKAGILENNNFHDTFLGIPQGGIASPILFNIYMHEFDLYIQNQIQEEFKKIKNTNTTQSTQKFQNVPKEHLSEANYNTLKSTYALKKKLTEKYSSTNSLDSISPALIVEYFQRSKYFQNILKDNNTLDKKLTEIKEIEKNYNHELDRGTLANKRKSFKVFALKNLSQEQKSIILNEFLNYHKAIGDQADKARKSISFNTNTQLLNKIEKTFYVRYADDWILFIRGTDQDAEIYKSLCKNYLDKKLRLTLSQDKTKITNFHKNAVKFLGFEIYYPRNPLLKRVEAKNATQRFRNIQIHPDRERLDNKFLIKKYIDNKNKPREVGFLVPLEDHQIIRKFNQFMLGIGNYYIRAISYPSRLNKYMYILYYSCIKTLATKHKTSTRKIIREYGYFDISLNEETKKPKATDLRIIAKYTTDKEEKYEVLLNWKEISYNLKNLKLKYEQTKHFKPIIISTIDFLSPHKVNFRTAFKTSNYCSICGDTATDLHHIRKLKHKGGRYSGYKGFDKVVASLNRKQIPVCKNCHNLIHTGKYDNTSLQDLWDFRLIVPENFITNEPQQTHNQAKSKTITLIKGTKSEIIINDQKRTYLNTGLRNFNKKIIQNDP